MKIPLPRRRSVRILIYITATLLVLLAIDLLLVRLGRRVTIAPDTTFITSPLKPDGYPDYHTFIETERSAGITATNNAAPILLQSFDPSLLPPKVEEATYAALHVSPPPPNTGLTKYEDFLKQKNLPQSDIDAHTATDIDQSLTHFWQPADHPLLAEFLRSQTRALAAFHTAAQLPRYYCPLIDSGSADVLISLYIPTLHADLLAAHLTLAQAMQDAAAGNFAKARQEILDVHRFAILLAQQPTMIEFISAVTLADTASQADAALASSEKLSAAQATAALADLAALPPMSSPIQAIDHGERLMGLDCFLLASRIGMPAALRLIASPPAAVFLYHFDPLNFNAALRTTNAFYDQLVAALNQPTYPLRIAALQAVDDRLRAYTAGNLVDPARVMLSIIFPSFLRAHQRDTTQRMRLDLATLAYALAAYHADHHTYPAALSDLQPLLPTIPPVIPHDLFTTQPLHYTKTPTGYLLYSAGPNMKDDTGKSAAPLPTPDFSTPTPHPPETPDDITITVP